MDAFDSFVADEILEKYKEACKLSEEESKNDPEADPYKSKYKAREIWQELKLSIDKHRNDNPDDERWGLLLAGLDLKLGVNFTETEELSTGEELLNKCADQLYPSRLDKRSCTTLLNTLNNLGILWTSRRRPEVALDRLLKADKLYKDFKHEVGGAPFMMNEIFSPPKQEYEDETLIQKRKDAFEDAYTHTLYYLAQVYGKLDENKKSAEYCHVTLCRQLDSMKYDPLDWALNAATLSQYYITDENFNMARHCLASATQIINETDVNGPSLPQDTDPESQAAIDAREKIPRAKTDISRCWIKYGLALLETSRDKLMESVERDDDEDEGSAKNNTEAEEDSDSDSEKKSQLYFNLEVTSQEEKITDKNLLVFDEARQVFLSVQKWVNEAKEFYMLDGHCSDHVELIQDHSKAFKFLSFFEVDFERQCKMHKRRIDMLEALLQQLNPQFYLLICRQLMYEIAETYSSMLDLKLSIVEERSVTPTPHAVRKINLLAEQSIKKYQEYLNSLKNAQKEMPEKFCDDDERPALVAFFCTGRLHSKFIEVDIRKRLHDLKNSLDCYNFLVTYCRKNPSSREKVKAEVDICEEMVLLMPAKMDKIRAEAEL